MIRPFVPERVDGEAVAGRADRGDRDPPRVLRVRAGRAAGTASRVTPQDQYFVDPNKLLLTTPGLDTATGEYEDFGVPANILANYLRENGVVPEKCDLNSILFLLTPAETIPKMQNLVAQLIALRGADRAATRRWSTCSRRSTAAHRERYAGYTIRRLAQEMHDFYKQRDVKQLQKVMFREEHFPRVACAPQPRATTSSRAATWSSSRCGTSPAASAAEGALPYPPGILCVVPGEVWGTEQRDYFLALEEGINLLPGFAPELQGVHLVEQP